MSKKCHSSGGKKAKNYGDGRLCQIQYFFILFFLADISSFFIYLFMSLKPNINNRIVDRIVNISVNIFL